MPYIMPKELKKQIVTGLLGAMEEITKAIIHAYTSDRSIIWKQVENDPQYNPTEDLQALVNILESHITLIQAGPFGK